MAKQRFNDPTVVATHADATVEPGPPGIRTFLIADVRGYTVFTQDHGDEAAAKLASKFAQLARQTVDARDGSVIELRGDEALAVFESARQAIRAAVDLQLRFVEETVGDPTLPLPVGIGLDAGEAVPVDGGYRGGALNLAARLCSLAGAGEVLASREVAHLARKVDGIKYVERGSIRLKGLPDPVDVVRVRPELEDPAQDVAFRRALGPVAARVAEGLEVRNPYKGLRAFEEADAADFFGREALTAHLVERLAAIRFLAVVGPSGSGKSSVVRAGLVPALRRGALPRSETWQIVEMFPGAHPLEELEAALLRVAANPPASLMEQLEDGERGLARAVKRILPADRGSELVLVLDQLEEVFTLVEDEERRTHFLSILERAVQDPHSRLRVVTTLRADFYDRPLLYSGFAELLRDYVEAVVPLTPDEFERAITRPAEGADIALEPGLLAEMVADVANEPGALPLLQYALTELYERRDGSVLTRDAYHAIGGVSGALGGRAEEIYAGLSDSAQDAARQLFLRLVTLGEGSEDTRRRVDRAELGSIEVDQVAMTEAVDAFGTARLLSFDRDPRTGTATVEVAHEALLREWPRLRGWIDAAREGVRMHRRLTAAAAEWEESGRDPSFMLRGGHLAQFEAWKGESGLALTELERDYIETSIRERAEEEAAEEARRNRETALERRSVNRMRALVGVFATAALVAAGLTAFAFHESGKSKHAALLATGRELTAASAANLEVDPERSILLALQAIDKFRSTSDTVPREPVEALHRAVESSRALVTFADPATGSGAWSPDERFVATGGGSGTGQGGAALWDARTGKKVRTFPAQEVHAVEFSPDGSRLYAAIRGRGVIGWDVGSGRRLFTLADSASLVSLAVSPDGARLATTAFDSTLTIWTLRGTKARKIKGPSALCGVRFSPDSRRIAAAGCFSADIATVWDVSTGKQLLNVNRGHGSVIDVAFSPNGRRLATVGIEGKGRVWDARSGRLLATLEGHTGWVFGVNFSPNGRQIATSAGDGTARLWDAATGRQLLVLAGHTGPIYVVRFSHDGRRLLTASQDGTDRIWDVSPGGGRDALTIAAHGGAPLGGGESVAFSPDGTRLATGGQGGAKVWSRATGKRLWGAEGAFSAHEVVFSPDGKRFLLSADAPSAAVFVASSGKNLFDLRPYGAPFHTGAAWSPDGKVIALGGVGTATSWDARTGKLLRSFEHSTDQTGPGQVFRVAFSPDGIRLFTGAWDGTVKIWNVASSRLLRTIVAHQNQVNGIAISPDGRRLVTGSSDGTAKIWALPSGGRLRTLTGHAGAIWDVAFSPDGKQVATAGDDTTTRLWDATTGRELLKLTGPTFALRRVAFSPDGTRLATASADGNVRVYILPLDELMRVARARLTRTWTAAECRRYLPGGKCPKKP